MGSFSGDIWSVEAAQTPMITPAHLNELAEWSEAEVTNAEEKTTAKGGKYASVSFRLIESKLAIRMNYFRPWDILPFLKILGLERLENSDQVVGKKMSLKFEVEKVDDKNYVRIAQYAVKGKAADSTPVKQQHIDEVPF